EALDAGGWLRKVKDAGQLPEVRFRIDGDRQLVWKALELLGFLGGAPEVGDGIPQLRRLFEIKPAGGLPHFLLELGEHFVGLACEKIAGGPDLSQVLLAGDIADARGGAVLEIRVEAVAVIDLAGREGPAAAKVELPAQDGEGAAHRTRMGEGPEIDGAVVLAEARQRETRDGVVEVDLEEEETLVVPKIDVEARLELLDQLALKQEGLGL